MADGTLSTTWLGATAQCVRWMPSVPPGPADLDGRLTEHKMMCWGHYDSDLEGHVLVFNDLTVVSRAGKVLKTEDDLLAGFHHAGRMTDLQVVSQGGGQQVVLFTTAEGALFLVRLVVPLTPGAGRGEIQVLDMGGGDGEEGEGGGGEGSLAPWLRLHSGAAASVDMHPDTKRVLTVGQDGRVYVLSPNEVNSRSNAAAGGAGGSSMMDTGEAAAASPATAPFKEGTGVLGYSCGRWADSNLFATSSTVGGLELWDVRQGPSPVARSPRDWGATGLGAADRGCHRSVTCLQVHPSRPNMCATGGSGGAVALWDLRLEARPLALAPPPPDQLPGMVWEVRFDTLEERHGSGATSANGGAQAPLPSLLFCTEEGRLCRASASGPATSDWPQQQAAKQALPDGGTGGLASTTLVKQPASVNSFDVGGAYDPDIVCVTDHQSLLYLHRR